MVHAQVTTVETPSMRIDMIGDTSNIALRRSGVVYAFPITISGFSSKHVSGRKLVEI